MYTGTAAGVVLGIVGSLIIVVKSPLLLNFIYVFGALRRFQHCTGHNMMGSWKGRGNQYIQFIRVLYCKLLTNSKQLPAFPLEAVPGTDPRPQRWEARVLPLCHCDPSLLLKTEVCTLRRVSGNEVGAAVQLLI